MSLDRKFLEAQMLYEKKISDLEAKLAESKKSEETYKSMFEIGVENNHSILKEIEQLKQQLVEKNKLLREKIGSLKTTDFVRLCLDCGFMIDAKDKDNQDKISFALEKLQETKDLILKKCFNTIDKGVVVRYYEIYHIFDNQIKAIKERE